MKKKTNSVGFLFIFKNGKDFKKEAGIYCWDRLTNYLSMILYCWLGSTYIKEL